MHTLNLGILAHVDAGKTSLTERLLHTAGVIDEVGSVDDGSTRTDSSELERRRGITITSAVVSFALGDVTVNLIDTPGHPDFIAEVERALSVLDGAVLVVSAVEGVQPQTRVLMRTLRRLGIPTLLFVNKIDRAGARYGTLLREIAEKLSPAVVPMGTVAGPGTRAARYVPHTGDDPDFTTRLLDVLAAEDDALLAAYVADETSVAYPELRRALAAQTARVRAHPVFFGSAVTGAGVAELADGIRELLPRTAGRADGPAQGTVFKIERGPAGERVAYLRMFSGTVRVRDRLIFTRPAAAGPDGTGPDGAGTGTADPRIPVAAEQRITGIGLFDQGEEVPARAVTAGRIATLRGLSAVRIGDTVGGPRGTAPAARHFAPPTLETVVVPVRPADRGALHAALTQLADQDPLINLRQDDVRREISVSLYGEVQKEVIQATLAEEYGIDVTFRETTTICLERPIGTGAAVEIIDTDPNPFLATVGLRVEPAPPGAGVAFRLGVELGSMPFAFFRAVEETVRESLGQGLHGWRVTDCMVTMTHAGYWPRQSHSHAVFDKSMSSTAGDFRNLTPLVLAAALAEARTQVYEPVHRFHLDFPAEALSPVLAALARLRAVPGPPRRRGSWYELEGEIPVARVHELERRLPTLTSGEGVLETAFHDYRPVHGTPPARPRTDHNPLDRKEYLLHVQRRV
ncbi:TetM/TetW/TetO/TetS family tetracycline resistance ribosomal protection protein [Streptomyces pactum]|uniref:TetM/TetW/TetO/TetS family tetracycline resistance ribosomal protection protein n=1 Tax=Streptomyces pactum TaxID=68249 RepID=A0ABS0NHV0_9ACTN|nr:TetM/TetW/TetO/TetS family tetracycline resistance ribosomal protection protein [Streptomyces pactum]MBH5334764.1 TetM/TetW/TetO/TetS family tetracycline resistance ribosomal protection protein [Streptomyces pactum]